MSHGYCPPHMALQLRAEYRAALKDATKVAPGSSLPVREELARNGGFIAGLRRALVILDELPGVTPVTEPDLTADKVHLSAVRNQTPESCEPPADPVEALRCPECKRTTDVPDHIRDKWCPWCTSYHPGTMPDWLRESFAERGEPLPADVIEADTNIGTSNPAAEPVKRPRRVWPVKGQHPRPAVSGELCHCGLPAAVVNAFTDGSERGYCELPDDGGRPGPCLFCEGYEIGCPGGGQSHEQAKICPRYRLRLDPCPDGGKCHHCCIPGDCWRVRECGPLTGVFPGDGWPPDVMARVADIHGAVQRQEMGPGGDTNIGTSNPAVVYVRAGDIWQDAFAGLLAAEGFAPTFSAPDEYVFTSSDAVDGRVLTVVVDPESRTVQHMAVDSNPIALISLTAADDEQPVPDVVTGHNWNPAETCPCATDPTARCEFPEVVPDE